MTSFDELHRGVCRFDLLHPKKNRKAGVIELQRMSRHPVYTFLDYIRGGTQIHFTVAIDFTVSNKDPASPFSLHHIHPDHPNQYMVALKAVGEIIEEYDTDKLFPALGFGARLPDGTIAHDFFLNTDSPDPHCRGVDGIMDAYKKAIRTVTLATPTYFTPVIQFVSTYAAAQTDDGNHYHVLLILTDGEITDYQQTKAAIVAASALPMSIIIIGVGPHEARHFSMNLLDSDKKLLRDQAGRVAKRDIVQFVAFSQYAREMKQEQVRTRLAMDVLAELPAQVVGWMKMKGVKPRPPLPSYHQATSDTPDTSRHPPSLAAERLAKDLELQNLRQPPSPPPFPALRRSRQTSPAHAWPRRDDDCPGRSLTPQPYPVSARGLPTSSASAHQIFRGWPPILHVLLHRCSRALALAFSSAASLFQLVTSYLSLY